MNRKSEQYPDDPDRPWTYRFEMVKTAVDILSLYSSELRDCTPPEIPERIAHVRGWTIRFDGLGEYSSHVPSNQLKSLAERLEAPIKDLSEYIDRFEESRYMIDPLLQTYEIMPGDEDALDSVRVLRERAVYLQQLATGQLNDRQ